MSQRRAQPGGTNEAASRCGLRGCDLDGPPRQQLVITPPPDGPPVVLWVHERCLRRSRDPSVEPDDPADHGRIPARARCTFCGRGLPVVGAHPFVLDVGRTPVPERFWVHARCMRERFTSGAMREIGRAAPGEDRQE